MVKINNDKIQKNGKNGSDTALMKDEKKKFI